MNERVTRQSYEKVAEYIDAGLRQYMLNVFSYMSAGLGLTALVAYFLAATGAVYAVFSNPLLYWISVLAPFGLAMYLIMRISSIEQSTARTMFFAYAVLLGVSMSSIFVLYSAMSIASTFFTTSAMFLSMVIYGYATDKDLTSFGSFLFMGLIGLIIASIFNIFIGSTVMNLVISAIGVIIFTGLTAFDVQKIKGYYLESDSSEVSGKKAMIGALQLYLDFVNLFLYLIRFLGMRSSND